VDIHVERHGSSFGRKFEIDRRSARAALDGSWSPILARRLP